MEKFYWEHWRGGDKCRRYWDQNPPIEGNSICIFVHLHSTGGGLSFHLCVVDKTPQSRLVQTDTPYSWGRLTEQLGLEGTSGDHAVHSGLSRWVWDVFRQGDSALPWAAVQGSATLMESSSSSHWVEFVIEFLWPLLLILLLNTTEKCCGSHFSVILDKGQCFIPAGNSWGSSEWVGIPSCSPDPWQCSVSEQHPPGVHRPETHRNSFCCSYTSGGAQVCLSPRNSPSMAVQAGLCVCMGTEVLQPQLPSLLCSGGAQHHHVTEGPSLPRPHQPLPKHQCSRPHTRDNGIVVVENMENPDSNPKCIGVLGL